ncbi:uncharacterized protein At1g76070-like [Rutidosis leptorrhynchoides]|uniref:uncharacterized protein At1g76070-like n=1 Tax=Rutidosis leptorrhynchoides TaxID=125765 RepID=UPI003A99D465
MGDENLRRGLRRGGGVVELATRSATRWRLAPTPSALSREYMSMTKILKFLPKTASVSFQNPSIYSPPKDQKSLQKPLKSNLGIGFNVTIISPENNLQKLKNNSSFKVVVEPTSPTVSCMGQVKCKHYQKLVNAANKKPLPISRKPISRTMSYTPLRTLNNDDYQEKANSVAVKTKKKFAFSSLFSCSSKKCDNINNKPTVMMNSPKTSCLSTMKKFSSGRDAFSSFDWTAQVVPLDNNHENYGSDNEVDENDTIPSSAPLMVGGVNSEPKKEINLWKRRTMAQPKPLQLQFAP